MAAATDDAWLVERAGGTVHVLPWTAPNFKVTTPLDLRPGRNAAGVGVTRSGIGYDCHRLVPGRRLVLGGVEIEYPLGLEGHSDADVLTHALIDALLGAAGLGDIGQHFPDTDEAYRDADSLELLRRTASCWRRPGFRS